MIRIYLILLVSLVALANINYSFAQNDSFMSSMETGGFAEVKNNNRAEAKKSAVKDAVQKAVEQVVEQTVSPEALVENYGRISNIYSNSEMYIHSYRFLSESFNEESNIYSVTLSITLYPRYINSLLASNDIIDNSGERNQKVLFMIKERGLSVSNESSYWENIPASELYFAEKMQSEGIDVINRNALKEKVNLNIIEKSFKGDIRAAIQAGLLSGAKIVITGNAVARDRGESNESPGFRNYQANISLKAYQTDTGKILGARSEFITISNEDPELGELEAFTRAGEKIYSSFLADIVHNDEEL